MMGLIIPRRLGAGGRDGPNNEAIIVLYLRDTGVFGEPPIFIRRRSELRLVLGGSPYQTDSHRARVDKDLRNGRGHPRK